MSIEKELIDSLKKMLGAKVIYSRAGGGMSSILLITTDNCLSLWCWRYWEIRQRNILLATSEDDDTPITGVMAKTASLLENKSIIGVGLDPENDYQLYLCFDDDLDLILFPEFERRKRFKHVNWELVDSEHKCSYIITAQLKLIKDTEGFE